MDAIAFGLIFAALLGLQVILFNRYGFRKLDYRCEFSVEEAHEGDNIHLIETVYNGKILPVPWLKVDIHSSRWLDFADTYSVVSQDNRHVTSSFALRSYQKVTRRWRLKCLKRGVFTTENVSLISGDLLDFSIISKPLLVNICLVVYPEIIDLDELFIHVSLLQCDRIVNRWIVDDPFLVSGSREYVSGDPMNRIHWPNTARTGQLMVKKNEFTSHRNLVILLNMQSQLYEREDTVNKEMAELGIKVAATLLDRILKEGAPVRLGTNGCVSPDSRDAIFTGESAGKGHVSGLLRILAGLRMRNVIDFETFLDNISPVFSNNEIIIVTAYLSKRLCEQSDGMAKDGNNVSVILLDKVFEFDERPCIADLYIRTAKRDERKVAT